MGQDPVSMETKEIQIGVGERGKERRREGWKKGEVESVINPT